MGAAKNKKQTHEIQPSQVRQNDIVVAELTDLAGRHGELSADVVLQEASDPSHVLHDYFEWDDTAAAHKHRLMQAMVLIRRARIHIVRQNRETKTLEIKPVRAVQSVPDRRGKGKASYRMAADIANDPEAHASLVRGALAELNAVRKRYEEITELAGVWEAVDAIDV